MVKSTILNDIIEAFTEGYDTEDKILLLRDMQHIIYDKKECILEEISAICEELAGSEYCPYCGSKLENETYNDTEVLEYLGIPTTQDFSFSYCPECDYNTLS